MKDEQVFNEALIRLCILLYHIDGRITLSEQDYVESIARQLTWRGDMEIEDFLSQSIYEIRDIIDARQQQEFVSDLKDDLAFDAQKALSVAVEIAMVDGKVADKEQEILDYLTHRVLAKALQTQLDANDEQVDLPESKAKVPS